MHAFRISACLFFITFVATGCVPTRGYEGPRLHSDDEVVIDAVPVLSGDTPGILLVHVINPVSGKPAGTGFSVGGKSGRLALPPGPACVEVQAQPIRCGFLGQCRSEGAPEVAEQICVDGEPGDRFRVEMLARANAGCAVDVEVTGYRLVNALTEAPLAEHTYSDYCSPHMTMMVGRWADAWQRRDGRWHERVAWDDLNKRMLKAWAGSPTYETWWKSARQGYDDAFVSFVEEAIAAR